MKKQDNIPYSLFAKFFSGEISEKEQKILDSFITESTGNEKIFQEYEQLWTINSGSLKFSDKTESALQKVKKEIDPKHFSNNKKNYRLIYRIAAAIILIFGLSYLTHNIFSEKKSILVRLETKDSILKKELTDGSIIWLNKNSKIDYPLTFAKNNRTVKLSGEAYFIISHNPEKPFIVKTESTTTEVLGTEFNIKANKKDKKIELVLVKGKVKFTDTKTKGTETLIKNQKVTLNKNNRIIDKSIVKSNNFLSWKTNEIDLNNLTVKQICIDLSLYFDKEIIAESNIKDISFHQTLPFSNPKLNDILNTIKFSLNLSIDTVDDKIILKKKIN